MKNYILTACVAMLFCLQLSAKGEGDSPQVYMFGVAGAFGDTIVCMTDIQLVESAKVGKHGFLEARNQYAYQLKGYLENVLGMPHRTCAIFFSEKKSKIEKKFLKVRKRYQKDDGIELRYVGESDFKFKQFSFE
ncbi:MAG: hypothetical protein IJ467_01525 [Bacteroidaceae bacterium]|nr:hypothetical protein [Bacteroidaceae bacterium]